MTLTMKQNLLGTIECTDVACNASSALIFWLLRNSFLSLNENSKRLRNSIADAIRLVVSPGRLPMLQNYWIIYRLMYI